MKKPGIRLLLVLTLCLTLTFGVSAADSEGAKEAVIQGIENHEAEVALEEYGLGQEEVFTLFRQVLDENPRFYYVRNGGSIVWSCGSTVTRMTILYMDSIGEAEQAAYEAAVQEALACVLPGMSDVQKALVLHDWLILHNAYDYERYLNGTIPDNSYSAYGAMALQTSVCEGYARAYADLLTRCGIPCITVSSESMNHTWNQVFLDGSWYHADVTWDDPAPDTPGQVCHSNFLKSDAGIQQSGSGGHYGWSGGQTCADTRYDSGALWSELRCAVCFTDADTLWLLRSSGEYTEQTISLTAKSFAAGKETAAVSVQDYWRVWGSENQYWQGSYSSLAMLDGRLYFNDTLRIYCYDPETGEKSTALTVSGNDGYLYGLFADDGELYYALSTTPEKTGTVYHLPLEKPEKQQPDSPFLDIPADSYFFDAAAWALETEVTTGTGTDNASGKLLFSPDATCTRGQVVTFLWRTMGKPEPQSETNPFPDVTKDDYFYKAVLWAVEQGITKGNKVNEDGQLCFGPDDECTYAHIITFLWRCVAATETQGGVWYEAPAAWAEENGLLGGVNIGDAPYLGKCPRKAVVLFLYRCAA